MLSRKIKLMSAVSLLVISSALSVGCTKNQVNQANQLKQQTVKTGQAPTQLQGNADQRIQIAKQAADKVTQINGVRQANVLVTQNNAYVAAILNTNQAQLTPDMKNQISQQVKATDPNIKHVYVSTSPEFVQHVNGYVNDVAQGKPVSGFFKQFSDMVQRLFPNVR